MGNGEGGAVGGAQGGPGLGGDILNTGLSEERERAMQVPGGVRGKGSVLGGGNRETETRSVSCRGGPECEF